MAYRIGRAQIPGLALRLALPPYTAQARAHACVAACSPWAPIRHFRIRGRQRLTLAHGIGLIALL
jgi:hypothetical protein